MQVAFFLPLYISNELSYIHPFATCNWGLPMLNHFCTAIQFGYGVAILFCCFVCKGKAFCPTLTHAHGFETNSIHTIDIFFGMVAKNCFRSGISSPHRQVGFGICKSIF
jgi:hypothetical protein